MSSYVHRKSKKYSLETTMEFREALKGMAGKQRVTNGNVKYISFPMFLYSPSVDLDKSSSKGSVSRTTVAETCEKSNFNFLLSFSRAALLHHRFCQSHLIVILSLVWSKSIYKGKLWLPDTVHIFSTQRIEQSNVIEILRIKFTQLIPFKPTLHTQKAFKSLTCRFTLKSYHLRLR